MLEFESGTIEKDVITLDINNLDGLTYDLIKKAFNEVLEQAGINPARVWHEEWTLTCKYFNAEEIENA